ncbi:hypothetical protein HY024_01855 [Candidatus Curtissbacteria bacterium]|nr:hypothetical protein [Candidatus Curtissbacteria bacterium]
MGDNRSLEIQGLPPADTEGQRRLDAAADAIRSVEGEIASLIEITEEEALRLGVLYAFYNLEFDSHGLNDHTLNNDLSDEDRRQIETSQYHSSLRGSAGSASAALFSAEHDEDLVPLKAYLQKKGESEIKFGGVQKSQRIELIGETLIEMAKVLPLTGRIQKPKLFASEDPAFVRTGTPQ